MVGAVAYAVLAVPLAFLVLTKRLFSGPYRFVRHPIYAGLLVILAGVLVGHHDITTLIPVACVALALVLRIVAEERAVLLTYPEYASYAQRTKRIIPWVL